MTHETGRQRGESIPGRMRRRDFLSYTGKAGAALAAVAGMKWLAGRAPAFAQQRTLHVLEWSSFVAPADVERDRQAEEFGKQVGVKVTVEHINANDLPARATAAIEGGTGPDIIQLFGNYPLLYAAGLDDHDDLIAELGGDEIYPFVRDAVRDEGGMHRGVPNFFGGGANVYRKDIFEEVGIARPPETWDEYLEAGKKLKHIGMPVGQSLAHTFGDAPGFADRLGHFLIPEGPGGRYHDVGPASNCIARYSPNKEAARDYIRFVHQDDNFEKFLVVNKGYVNGPLPKWQEHPMWEEDPAVTIYRELPQYGRNHGYAGPYNRQSSEATAKYIIVDLFAKAVRGDSTQSVIEAAERELKAIYEA